MNFGDKPFLKSLLDDIIQSTKSWNEIKTCNVWVTKYAYFQLYKRFPKYFAKWPSGFTLYQAYTTYVVSTFPSACQHLTIIRFKNCFQFDVHKMVPHYCIILHFSDLTLQVDLQRKLYQLSLTLAYVSIYLPHIIAHTWHVGNKDVWSSVSLT